MKIPLLFFSGVEQFLAYRVGLISGKFYNVLGKKSKPGFIEATWHSAIIIAAMTITKSARVFTSKMLAIAWRLNLTQALHTKYFSDTTYYMLNILGKWCVEIDSTCIKLLIHLPFNPTIYLLYL